MSVFLSGKEKRASYDYRGKYLKHNPGFFGKFYICSQCYKSMRESDMEVDHIVPNSKWFAPNRVFNCVAICSSCNKEKSAKMGTYLYKGLLFKFIEELYIFIHKGFFLLIKLLSNLLLYLHQLLFKNLSSKNPTKIILSLGMIVCLSLYILNLLK